MSGFLDSLLEYNTIKVVRVRSKVLGGMHYLFMGAIALYIGGVVFYHEKHYLAFEPPAGLQRVTIQNPCDAVHDADYCTFPTFAGKEAFGQTCYPPKAFRCPHHDYCKDANTPPTGVHGGVNGKLTCRFWDHNSMVWPPAERGAFTMASRASLLHQELIDVQTFHKNGSKVRCENQKDIKCQWYPPIINHTSYEDDDAYMSDLGNFTVRISHSMWAPSFPVNGNSGDMEGWLLKCKPGADCEEDESWMPIKHLPKTGSADELFMRDIFYAATPAGGIGVHGPGLDMEEQSDACPMKCAGEESTYRFMGVVIHAKIIYDNTGTLIEGSKSDAPKYWVKLYTKPSTIFHVEVVQKGSILDRRTIHHLYGPRVVFDVGGKVGQFRFNHVLVQLTTSLAMFTLATTMVDFLMIYVLGDHEKYYEMKYVEYNEHEQHGLLPAKSARREEDLETKGYLDAGYERTEDPLHPPGMTLPPGMQKAKGENQPLLGPKT